MPGNYFGELNHKTPRSVMFIWVHLKKVGYLVFVKAEEKDNVFNIFHLPAL